MVCKLRSWAPYGPPKTMFRQNLNLDCRSLPKFGSNLVGRRRRSFHLRCFVVYVIIVLNHILSVNVIVFWMTHSTRLPKLILSPYNLYMSMVTHNDYRMTFLSPFLRFIGHDGPRQKNIDVVECENLFSP